MPAQFIERSAMGSSCVLCLEKKWLNARPHPDPLPRGEGTAIRRLLVFWKSSGNRRAWIRGRSGEQFSLSHRMGEGRGEGGFHFLFCAKYSSSSSGTRIGLSKPEPMGAAPFTPRRDACTGPETF